MKILLRRLFVAAVSIVGVAVGTLMLPMSHAIAQKRLALVIGNSNYQNISPLKNPTNDATDIAAKLRALKFEVVVAMDVEHAIMQARILDFAGRITDKDIALVFYAGHGVTVNGESYLLPVDVPQILRLPDATDQGGSSLDDHLVGYAKLLEPLRAAKLGIVFLDACRTSATKDVLGLQLVSASSRSIPIVRGTASLSIKPSPHSAGVFRAYATQLDNVADDGTGRNSPFTKALLQHIATPGIQIQELMIRIRRSVMQETKNQQIPWEEAALNESFAFVPQVGPTPSLARPSSSTGGSPASASSTTGGSSGGGGAGRSNSSASPQRSSSAPARPSQNGSLPPGIGFGAGAGL
ncbi:MAG: caspase family protein [Hyphomicrobiaceae bacterium]|nr:caspase family protein [Hyphomicrobiaceae bacterium]